MTQTVKGVGKKRTFLQRLSRDFKMNKYKYLLILPVLIYLALFAYKPMYGIVIAFKNYKPTRGIMRSQWVGFMWFENFFKDIYFWRLLRNTFTISALSIVFGFPAPILLALLLNEIHHSGFKRTVQTITYMPYFISLVVTCSIIKIYCQENGLFSQIAELFGGTRKNFLIEPRYFRTIYVVSGIWQNIGWNSILYLAALSGIDQEQYEAARIDGANRFQQIWNITIPGMLPTIVLQLILNVGHILDKGFEHVLVFYNPAVYETSDIIMTYVYRQGIGKLDFSRATALGLFNSVVAFILIVGANAVSKRTLKRSIW